MDWEKFYSHYPLTVDPKDFLKQVGHTIGGQSISPDQFTQLLLHIHGLLQLKPGDRLLDLCCGNGLITRQLAQKCSSVVGIDFSQPLLQTARTHHAADNLRYVLGNALQLNQLPEIVGRKFDKVLIFAALQHFRRSQLDHLLRSLIELTVEGRVIVIGFVPDLGRRSSFYDTGIRRIRHAMRKLLNKDRMGTWWDKAHIVSSCERLHLHCRFDTPPAELNRGSYRYSVRIE